LRVLPGAGLVLKGQQFVLRITIAAHHPHLVGHQKIKDLIGGRLTTDQIAGSNDNVSTAGSSDGC
jgi:hypothetical protein